MIIVLAYKIGEDTWDIVEMDRPRTQYCLHKNGELYFKNPSEYETFDSTDLAIAAIMEEFRI